jgi:hypothetical protein
MQCTDPLRLKLDNLNVKAFVVEADDEAKLKQKNRVSAKHDLLCSLHTIVFLFYIKKNPTLICPLV